ncbi:MAG TPA: hypothetical protein VHW23_42280 [Kofleriaceae bacterium]|nr:hypothetical protein [Kofleriaceae bacterium]
MRKILVVVVMAGVACRGPAPETPVTNRTVEHVTPKTGRIELVQAHGTDPFSDVERTYGPVIASGTVAGSSWSLRGRISARGAATWVQTSSYPVPSDPDPRQREPSYRDPSQRDVDTMSAGRVPPPPTSDASSRPSTCRTYSPMS